MGSGRGGQYLERDLTRFKEITDELAEIGTHFETAGPALLAALHGPKGDEGQAIAESIARLKVPGYRAYYLAMEGIALVQLCSLAIGLKLQSQDFRAPLDEHALERWGNYLDDSLAVLQRTMQDMAPYTKLSSQEVLEALVEHLAQRP